MATLLAAEALGKRFGGLTAVDGLSFTADEGEILGLIGPNGAGKTTTFNLISGVYPLDSGRLFLGDRDITRLGPHQRCHCGIGRTFQVVQPFEEMTVEENVMIGAIFGRPRPLPQGRAREEARRLLDLVGLASKAGQVTRQLNAVELKRLEMARALAPSPRLLLLDEVMEGLTQAEAAEAITLVRKIRDLGVTVLVIEHVMSTVRDVCDRVIVMHYGRQLAAGTYTEVARDPAVIEAYLGEKDEGHD
ncbi:MAG TPA: ABC transporter ATP-binding protein [Bacillota bacterium]|jgi:branched-chain amino acid transport system ATP-binding protein